MAEFIGARISLVSNSDIRYVGTLHEINSETSTVALENVSMLGTEGRRPDNEVAALDSVYEYILFRGTDVKDLRIEEAPAPKEQKPPQIPHDPAILGSRSRPVAPVQPHTQYPPQVPSLGLQGAPSYGQYPNYYPPPATWGRGGPPGLGCMPTMPYGGWHPGSQQAYAHGPQFLPHGYPPGPSASLPIPQNNAPANLAPSANSSKSKSVAVPLQQSQRKSEKTGEKQTSPPAVATSTTQLSGAPTAVLKPLLHKNDEAQSSSATIPSTTVTSSSKKAANNGQKSQIRIRPAVPLPHAAPGKEISSVATGIANSIEASTASERLRGATEAAAAAVSAAISKLPSASVAADAVEKLTMKVQELDTNGSTRDQKQHGKSTHGAGKSSRGGLRAARGNATKVEVPKEDFDFESANAKFSKETLAKEALSDSSNGEKLSGAVSDTKNASVIYNKAASFFDNISSEAKDRQESRNLKPGCREWRGEEQKKNLETFGQESVDNGYRGGHRGRGRGRGGYRGRGYNGKRRSSRGDNLRSRGETQSVAN